MWAHITFAPEYSAQYTQYSWAGKFQVQILH